MTEIVKIPRPSSKFLDEKGNVTREWIAFLQKVGVVTSPLSSLAQAKIWIGDSTSTPVQRSISGDGTLSSSGVLTVTGLSSLVTQSVASKLYLFYNAGGF